MPTGTSRALPRAMSREMKLFMIVHVALIMLASFVV
jgi:hypothetical protein